ncbi:MAG: IS481 family transposase [Microbacteriaceae bacterium]
MSKARVIVLSVVHQGLTKAEVARKFGVSWQWVHTLVVRFESGGLDALEPRSRRPRASPSATATATRLRIVALREQLVAAGLDAGPVTIAWHLEQEGLRAPAVSTIRRIITGAGLVTSQPRKRPRSAYIRFAADQPNETWQSDFTHWTLAGGRDVEILNWLDDHSRLLLSCTAHSPVTGIDVVTTFTTAAKLHGIPASTLTDNGAVYTAKYRGGRNAFENLIQGLGVAQKNGLPYHPQTQGKIERFHQTLKLWLHKQPPAETVRDLQAQLDQFRAIYNQHRPHRAIGRQTPQQAYDRTLKASPTISPLSAHYRVRLDVVDNSGKITLRHAGTLRHLGIGRGHATTPVLILVDKTTATVTHLTTGEILSSHLIDPDKNYWRNQNKEPGRWPGSS